MFSSAKQQINKMMSFLPNPSDMMTLEEYNVYYKQMMKNQTDEKGNELPQAALLQEQHHRIISNVLSGKMNSMKMKRNKKNVAKE